MCVRNPATDPHWEFWFSKSLQNLDFLQLCLCFVSRIVHQILRVPNGSFCVTVFRLRGNPLYGMEELLPSSTPHPHTHTARMISKHLQNTYCINNTFYTTLGATCYIFCSAQYIRQQSIYYCSNCVVIPKNHKNTSHCVGLFSLYLPHSLPSHALSLSLSLLFSLFLL